ncbi:MAG: deoxyribodipyrimidine photo-lyase [Haloarculaceae archaeon]
MQIHWHRRDLRARDNAALAAADGPILPVFVFDDAVLAHAAPPRVAFLLDALAALRAWYRERESDLLVARGDPRERLPALADEHDADAVTWAEDYSGLAADRDEAVRRALTDAGVESRAVTDAVLHAPGSITTNEGEPYAVFSYYGRKWLDRPADDPHAAPAADALAPAEDDPLPGLADLGFDDPEATVPPAGQDVARDRLESFCAGPIYRYAERRDYPAENGTSRLSPHLKFGTVGVRAVYAATERAMGDADGEDERESVTEFRRQLAWREFYAQVLADDPSVVTENYREYANPIEWREDPAALRAWQDGETGYPLVDAGMRQLREEAWMHNRLRMVVASFLTKDLLIDWRRGYEWFREKLVDHDPANDSGGWQWAASTGTDAQPYFRIFNPASQCAQYDPDGGYVREYVPELRGVDAELIHEWPDLSAERRSELAPDYPDPIVDHAERREQAIAMFEAARGES